jgi:hypothetical protein
MMNRRGERTPQPSVPRYPLFPVTPGVEDAREGRVFVSQHVPLFPNPTLTYNDTHTLHSLFYSMHAAHFRRPSHMSDNSYSARSLADSLAYHNESAYSGLRSPSGLANGCLIFSLLHSCGVPVTTRNLCALVDALLHVRLNLIKELSNVVQNERVQVKEGEQNVPWESVIDYPNPAPPL